MNTDFVIFKACGRQFKASESDKLTLEKLDGKVGEKVSFPEVLLSSKKGKTLIGKPFIKDIKVSAKIIEQGKGEKIRVFKYKAKSRYRKAKGHRQLFTKVEITNI